MKGIELSYTTLLRAELLAVRRSLGEMQQELPPDLAAAVAPLVNGNGKLLRPALTLLTAGLCGVALERALPMAAAVEMLHSATLIHDDLIDAAAVRRGVETLNRHWPAGVTVLAGDVAFAWAARLAVRGGNLELVARFAETLGIICRGELDQMFRGRGAWPTPADYETRIFAKTASLFALTTESGAVLAEAPPAQRQALYDFGKHLGLAFQIVDDVLDFTGDAETLGKPVGGDLRQGLLTLPLLYYAEAHPHDPRLLQVVERTADEAALQALIADLRRSDVGARTLRCAEDHVTAALAVLQTYPPGPYRAALEEIAGFTVQRRH